jgi:small ligand-binding sensory domain FIST
MSRAGDYISAHASAEQWRDAAGGIVARLGRLDRSHRLGFVFVTEAYARDLDEIEVFLRQATGVSNWVGAAGLGVCGHRTEYFDEPAMSVLVLPVDDDAFRLFRDVNAGVGDVVAENLAWLQAADPPLVVTHADPGNAQIQSLVEDLSDQANAYLVGGITSGDGDAVQLAGKPTSGGLSGVFLSPHAVPVAVGLTQGCSPIGPAHKVTRAEGNVLIELDEQPALEVFRDDIGEVLSRDLRRVSGYIFAALAVTGSDTGDYLVRNLMGVDNDNGLVAIGDVVSTGDQVIFCRRDQVTATDDLRRMLDRLKQRAGGGVKAGLYYSCIARGPNQFGPDSRELKIITDELGDFPIAGLFANGEINHNRLYGYTGVLTLFL